MYLLDSNACIRILNGTSEPLIRQMRTCDPAQIRLCSVTKAELLFGARRSAQAAVNLRTLGRFFVPFISLPFDDDVAEEYGVIRADLALRGALIGPLDMMIAATARRHDLTLITHNVEEFERVPGLRWEDWER